jgi:CheY-like chemotaxis protein
MKKILLIEDDEVANFLLKKALETSGLASEVDSVLNGEEAIDLLNKNTGDQSIPDIILLDLNMPVMNGFEFLEAFKKLDLPHKDQVKIIIVTSSVDQRDIMKAKEMGVENYISKPISGDKLRNAFGS